MKIPDIWGQGQIFAFSAIDGKTSRKEDFVGILAGDRVGIRFHTKTRRELAIVGSGAASPDFHAVCGDYICADSVGGSIKILFYTAHTVIGEVPEGAEVTVFTEGKHNREYIDNVEVHDTCDGEYTALLVQGKKFAFSYAEKKEIAVLLAKGGIFADVDKEEEKKIDFYKKYSNSKHYELLYSKCLSVMKTQLFSPEGVFKTIWSTPDRLPHRDLWLWDSVFHAIGFRNVDGRIAESLILSMLESRQPDGRIPCRTTITKDGVVFSPEETQPPVIAWGAWKVYQKTKNKEFLKRAFEENSTFLKWCMENRQYSDGLYAWWVDESQPFCRCGESGMDNSPRFDETKHLLAVDFSCFMANEMRYMVKIADELKIDSKAFAVEFNKIKNAINEKLWDEESEYYFDYDADREKIHKVKTPVTFLPLFSGVCDKEKADKLIGHLTNPSEFYSEFPIPSVSKDDATYGSDMWRGPVWINYNYMICEGLREYGFSELSQEILEKTVSVVEEWYEKNGTIYEFYDSENKKSPSKLSRKGDAVEPYDICGRIQAIRDYGWSCCLTLDIIENL